MTKKYKEKLWPKKVMQMLLLKFEDVYMNLNHENLCKKWWNKVANDVNLECTTFFIEPQFKMKGNKLKKTFKKEKQIQNNRHKPINM